MPVFTMPSLGADMEAGTLVEWMIKPGDTVKRGDVVAVVETQKGAIEIECFEEGSVETLDAELGQELPVGAPLATIRAKVEAPAAAGLPAEAPPAPAPKPAAAPSQATAPPRTRSGSEPPGPAAPPEIARKPEPAATAAPPLKTPDRSAPAKVPRPEADAAPPSSPAARALAAERGIDIAGIEGSGPGGAVLLADIEAAAPGSPQPALPEAAGSEAGPAKAGAPPARPGLDLAAMRAAIAAAMARSKREIPHYYLTQTIDLQPAADWLAETNARRPPDSRLLMGALMVKASALAAAKVGEVNGHYGADGFRPSKPVHAGLAVALRGGGLIAPAIHDAETLTLDETMAAMRDLVARARTGRLRSSEMTDGTITISAMGETGAEAVAAVIFPPQVAILGIGAPVLRPWIAGGAIAPHLTVTVTLSADHRVSDGRRGARFLAEIDTALQTPEAL